VLRAAAFDSVDELVGSEGGGGGQDDGADFHDGEHGFPEFDLVVEHEDDVVAAGDAVGGEVCCDLVGAVGHVVEGVCGLGAVFFDDPQCGVVVAAGVGVEPVDRPVEPIPEVGPDELLDGLRIVTAQVLQEVACLSVDLSGCLSHESTLSHTAAAQLMLLPPLTLIT